MAMKRPAATGLESAKKRVKSVAKALEDCEDHPGSMLASCLEFSLGVFKEVRSAMQIEVVDFVGEALASLEKGLEAEAADATAKCANVYTDKEERKKAQEAAEAALDGLKAALAAAQGEEKEVAEEAEIADTALETAQDEQKTGDKDITAVIAKKTKIASAETEAYTPLKEDALEGAAQKKGIKQLVSTGKAFGFDSSLLEAAPNALGKKTEARSDFDKIIVEKLQEEFKKTSEALDAEIKGLEPGKAERAAKVDAAKAASDAAGEKLQAKKDAVKAAKENLKAGEKAKKDASLSVKSWLSDIKDLFDASDEAKESLTEFREGPLKTYAELKEMETPPEPVEEEEEEEAEGAAEEAAPAEETVPETVPAEVAAA